uniref:Large ribosomal subunit protein uL23m n=1 Tax=Ditylenchus dipsaci TaxID=166011 RepID=A0A915EKH7_9BILA
MSTRIQRLWQPGNPQTRVFLPDFWLKLVETPKTGRNQLPKNAAKFEVDLRMSKLDVRQYLEKIYKLPVRDVRTIVEMGEILWESPKDKKYKTARWKDEDKKYAFVFFKKDFVVEFPDIFRVDHAQQEIDRAVEQNSKDPNRRNFEYMNQDRVGVGKMFGV